MDETLRAACVAFMHHLERRYVAVRYDENDPRMVMIDGDFDLAEALELAFEAMKKSDGRI